MRAFGLILVAIALCVVAVPALAATKTVSVKDNFFSKQKVTINKGDKVKWAWAGAEEHDVEFVRVPDGAKKPRACSERTSGTCTRKFGKPGVYRYVCTIHFDDDAMKGRVTVRKPG